MRQLDLIGQRFGSLVVVAYQPRPTGPKRTFWLCKCDCGGTSSVYGAYLNSGHTRSCGCQRGSSWKLKYGESTLNRLFGRYARDAKQRGIVFELSREQFAEIVQRDCSYCGEPPRIVRFRNHIGEYAANGVDRVDSAKGYAVDNAVACCRVCNDMKGTLSRDAFIGKAERIAALAGREVDVRPAVP